MSALPPFQIRGLLESTNGEIAISATADANAKLVDVRLDTGKQYDELVAAQPVAMLGYIDDDDGGDVITVGSSTELYDRIDEVRMDQMKPVVFELMASLKRSNATETAEGLKRWKEFVEREWKGKGPVRLQEAQIIDAMPPTVEDEVSSTSSTMAEAPSSPQIPFLSAFEAELKSLLEQQQQEVDDPEMQAPKSCSSASSSSTSESTSEPSSSAHGPNDIIFQAIQSIRWAGECMARLKTELPHRAQPAVENLNTVVHSAITALTAQMHQIALEAAEKAKKAAETTRGVDLGEIEAAKEKIRLLAQGIGHIASQTAVGAGAAARDIARDVRKAKSMAEELGRDVVRGMRVEFGEDFGTPRSGSEGNQSPSIGSSIVEMVKPLDVFDSAKKQPKQSSIVWSNSPSQISASSSSEGKWSSGDDGLAPVPKPFTYHEDARRLEYQKRLIGNLQRRHTAKFGSPQELNPEKKAETFWQHMEKISSHSGSSVKNEPPSRSETALLSLMAGNGGYDEEEEKKQAPSEREREVRRARSHYFIRRNRREARQARQERERETAKQNPENFMFGEIGSEIPQGRFKKSEENLKNLKGTFAGNPAGFPEPMFMNPICADTPLVVTKSQLQYPPQQEMLYLAPVPPVAPKPPVDEEQRVSPNGSQGQRRYPSDGYQLAMTPPFQIPDFGAEFETRPLWPRATQDLPYLKNPNIGDHPAPEPEPMRRPHSMYFNLRTPHSASRPLPPKPSVEDASDSEADPRSFAAEISTLRRHRSMHIPPTRRRSPHASLAPPPKPSIQDATDSEADEHRYARHPSNITDPFLTHQSSPPLSHPFPSLPPCFVEMSPAPAPPPQPCSPSPQFHCSWEEAEQATKQALAKRNLGETAVSYNMLRGLRRACMMEGEEALETEVDKWCRKDRIRKERLERMENERREREMDDEKPVMPGEFVSEESVQEKENRAGENAANKNGNDGKAAAPDNDNDDLYSTPTTASYRAPDLTLSDSDSEQDPTHPLAYLRPRRNRSAGPSPAPSGFRPRPVSPPPPTALDLLPSRGPYDAHFTTPWALKQQWKENQEIGIAMEMERKEREEKIERCVKVLEEMGFVVDEVVRMVVEEAGGEVERVVEML